MTQSKYIMNKTKYEMVVDIRKTKKTRGVGKGNKM